MKKDVDIAVTDAGDITVTRTTPELNTENDSVT
jgi:hypothetical protein